MFSYYEIPLYNKLYKKSDIDFIIKEYLKNIYEIKNLKLKENSSDFLNTSVRICHEDRLKLKILAKSHRMFLKDLLKNILYNYLNNDSNMSHYFEEIEVKPKVQVKPKPEVKIKVESENGFKKHIRIPSKLYCKCDKVARALGIKVQDFINEMIIEYSKEVEMDRKPGL